MALIAVLCILNLVFLIALTVVAGPHLLALSRKWDRMLHHAQALMGHMMLIEKTMEGQAQAVDNGEEGERVTIDKNG